MNRKTLKQNKTKTISPVEVSIDLFCALFTIQFRRIKNYICDLPTREHTALSTPSRQLQNCSYPSRHKITPLVFLGIHFYNVSCIGLCAYMQLYGNGINKFCKNYMNIGLPKAEVFHKKVCGSIFFYSFLDEQYNLYSQFL